MSMRRHVQIFLTLAWAAAGTLYLRPGAEAADAPWAVKAAPYRVVVRLETPPTDAEVGTEIQVPDLGVAAGAKGGDYAMADSTGAPVPVAVVWQGEGQDTLLLANGLQSGQDYYLYIGGPRGATWTPKTSLLFETRSLTGGHSAFTSSGMIEDAWKNAPTLGAKFTNEIFSANNPFGEGTNFLSHYIGYLVPQGGGAGGLHQQFGRLVRAARRTAVRRLAGQSSGDRPAKGGASEKAAGVDRPNPRGLLSGQDRRRPAGHVPGMDS